MTTQYRLLDPETDKKQVGDEYCFSVNGGWHQFTQEDISIKPEFEKNGIFYRRPLSPGPTDSPSGGSPAPVERVEPSETGDRVREIYEAAKKIGDLTVVWPADNLVEEFKRNHHNPIVASLNEQIRKLEEIALDDPAPLPQPSGEREGREDSGSGSEAPAPVPLVTPQGQAKLWKVFYPDGEGSYGIDEASGQESIVHYSWNGDGGIKNLEYAEQIVREHNAFVQGVQSSDSPQSTDFTAHLKKSLDDFVRNSTDEELATAFRDADYEIYRHSKGDEFSGSEVPTPKTATDDGREPKSFEKGSTDWYAQPKPPSENYTPPPSQQFPSVRLEKSALISALRKVAGKIDSRKISRSTRKLFPEELETVLTLHDLADELEKGRE